MRTGPLIVLLVIIATLSVGMYFYIRSTQLPMPAPSAPAVGTATPPASTTPIAQPATTTVQAPPKATSTPPTRKLPPGTYADVVLALGDTRSFYGNLTIMPTYVVNDSRCPLGVFCIQFGTLTLAFDAKVNGVMTHQALSQGQSVKLGGHVVTLTSVEPLKRMQTVIDPSDYRFTFSIQ